MSRDEAMKLIEGHEYADSGFRRKSDKGLIKLVSLGCKVALLKRKNRNAQQFLGETGWFWKNQKR